eukprot:GEMP01104673.1.p2 GENE.GEMP01104673.1~~GEMP01104673.1.p2  ORF type:complete len:119 (-),score=8.32 GEMP01104673.1:68-424(-)
MQDGPRRNSMTGAYIEDLRFHLVSALVVLAHIQSVLSSSFSRFFSGPSPIQLFYSYPESSELSELEKESYDPYELLDPLEKPESSYDEGLADVPSNSDKKSLPLPLLSTEKSEPLSVP